MRVLIVDDLENANLTAAELSRHAGFDVTVVTQPYRARALLGTEHFDVVVADILFEPLCKDFKLRLRRGEVSLSTDTSFLVSGLMTLYDTVRAGPSDRTDAAPGRVIWTVGEGCRELHMVFAHQELGARVWCSKVASDLPNGGGSNQLLADGIRAAALGHTYIDPVAASYLPRPGVRPLRELFFAEECWRGIWRALALGVRGQAEIGQLTGYSRTYVRNEMRTMADNLFELSPGLDQGAGPYETLAPYAGSNWEFFLDDTVMRMFSPAIAQGVRQEAAHE